MQDQMEVMEFTRRKRGQTYRDVISKAILSSPQQKLTLSEIYRSIEEHFPGFTATRLNWRNTVRHNLSLHECFVKEPNSNRLKGFYWKVRDFAEKAVDNFYYQNIKN